VTSLRKNTIANYVGQVYTNLIGIVILPFYLKYLGAEAYGLVGFFAVMQAWFGLLDMGLSPTLSRQVAHSRSAIDDGKKLLTLLRSVEWLFGILSLIIAAGVALASNWIAGRWLTVQQLSYDQVAYCIALMGCMIGMRWFNALYRGVIQGNEQMVWLNAANSMLVSFRFIGAYVLLRWVSQDPSHFFEFQLIISLLELLVLHRKSYIGLSVPQAVKIGFSTDALKSIAPFAGGLAYTSALWILITQTDKLILSHTLSLKEYGYFALVAVVANGLLSMSTPVSQAILPRLTLLHAQGKIEELVQLYCRSTRVVSSIVFPITGILAVFSHEILLLWTGDKVAADWAGPVLRWFIIGNAILTIAAFQYYLQFAYAKLRLHVVNTTINAFIQIPFLAAAAYWYGAMGVAYTWFGIRLITFFVFTAVVHRQFLQGLHLKWLFRDVLSVFTTTAVLTGSGYWLAQQGDIHSAALLWYLPFVTVFTCGINYLLWSKTRVSLLLHNV